MNLTKEYQKSIKNLKINPFFLKRLIKYEIEKNHLEKQIEHVVFTNETKRNNFVDSGIYNKYDKELVLNLSNYIGFVINNSPLTSATILTPQHYEYIYNQILFLIYHELEHAKQEKTLQESDLSYVEYLLAEAFMVMENDKNLYINNHNLFATEHSANIKARINANKFLYNNSVFELTNENINEYEKNTLAYFLNDYIDTGDKIISPLEQFYSLNKQLSTGKDQMYEYRTTPYKSLLYGLPISKEVFKELKDIYDNDKVTDIVSYVKSL